MSAPVDIFFYEAFEEEHAALLRHTPPAWRVAFTPLTRQEAGHTIPPAPIISIRTQSTLPDAWAGSLRAVLTRSAGYDHVAAWQEKNHAGELLCGYLPLYCVQAVAEQAMLLWMALLRKLPRQQRQFHAFHRDGLTGGECKGRHLVVVGVGRIGSCIARLGRALGMTVTGVDLAERHPDISYASLEQALPTADILVAAMNLTPLNHHYFTYERLAGARPGLLFVNIARGELAPAADLLRLLDEGILGGAAMDVFEREDLLAVHLRDNRQLPSIPAHAPIATLARMENVLLTPHNAFNSGEAVERKAEQSIRQIHALAEQGAFLWPVPPRQEAPGLATEKNRETAFDSPPSPA